MSAVAVLTPEQLRALVRDAVRQELDARGPGVAPAEVMTRAQVAELLQVEEHTVTRWIRKKGLPGTSVGAVWRFRRSDVLKWMQEQKR